MEQLEKWAEDLTKEVYTEWKLKYNFWDAGFKVFYSPIRKNPKLAILSLNPGGTVIDFKKNDYSNFQQGNFSLPPKNSYLITNYPFAKKMREFFKGYEEMLETSVALPILFFRSKDWNYWKGSIPNKQRKEMEQFSFNKVKEIIQLLNPEMILVIGFRTYEKIKRSILDIEKEKSIWSGIHRLYLTANTSQTHIFCIPHLTGYFLSNSKFKKIREEFFDK